MASALDLDNKLQLQQKDGSTNNNCPAGIYQSDDGAGNEFVSIGENVRERHSLPRFVLTKAKDPLTATTDCLEIKEVNVYVPKTVHGYTVGKSWKNDVSWQVYCQDDKELSDTQQPVQPKIRLATADPQHSYKHMFSLIIVNDNDNNNKFNNNNKFPRLQYCPSGLRLARRLPTRNKNNKPRRISFVAWLPEKTEPLKFPLLATTVIKHDHTTWQDWHNLHEFLHVKTRKYNPADELNCSCSHNTNNNNNNDVVTTTTTTGTSRQQQQQPLGVLYLRTAMNQAGDERQLVEWNNNNNKAILETKKTLLSAHQITNVVNNAHNNHQRTTNFKLDQQICNVWCSNKRKKTMELWK